MTVTPGNQGTNAAAPDPVDPATDSGDPTVSDPTDNTPHALIAVGPTDAPAAYGPPPSAPVDPTQDAPSDTVQAATAGVDPAEATTDTNPAIASDPTTSDATDPAATDTAPVSNDPGDQQAYIESVLKADAGLQTAGILPEGSQFE